MTTAGLVRRASLGVALGLLTLSGNGVALAQTATATAPAPLPSAAASPAHRLNWIYPRFRLWEYVAAFGASATGFFLQYGIEGDFRDGSWDNGILFDEPIRDALVAKSAAGRERAHMLGDYFWMIPQYFPVVDSIVTPLATDKLNVDVAFQLTMLNWQAQGMSFLLTRIAHRTAGRARPSLQGCKEDPYWDGACDPASVGRTASFISGHTSMATAGASLTCAHHQALPLYGGGAADVAICVLMLTAAGTNGVLRIVADKHWATDVLAGAVVGAATGYGLPWLLHYRYGRYEAVGAAFLPPNTAIIPLVSEDSLGMGLTGLF